MKLIKTEKYNSKLYGYNYRCNVYIVRLFSKEFKVSSNYIYGGGVVPTWKECIDKYV